MEFEGEFLDIGIQRTCIGLTQTRAYCRERNAKLVLKPSRNALKFANDLQTSLDLMEIRIPTPDGSFIQTKPEVVRAEAPFLLGIDILDKEALVADNVRNMLECPKKGWVMPIMKKRGLRI